MIVMWGLLLAGCKKDSEEEAALPEVCNAGSAWSEGTAAFDDATEAWGLYDINAAGVVINAVDIDGDGWTDLAVRSHGGVDDFSEGGTRSTWLLRNTGSGFEDITESSGVLTPRQGGSDGRPGEVWAFGDVDSDGDLDLFTGCPDSILDCGSETSEIMLNDGTGSFTLGPESSDARDADDPGGASFVDVNRDGHLDLWVPHYYVAQDRLYLGDGTGAFTDATEDAGLETKAWSSVSALNDALSHTVAWSALACDLNRDGDPELLAASYGRAPNHLWQAAGGGSYDNRSIESGYAFDHRVDWTDNESARCWCMLNPDDAECDGVPAPSLIACSSDDDAFRWDHSSDRNAYRLGGNSGATTCADVNNDGWMDLLTSEIVHWDVGSSSDPSELMFNQGSADVVFSRPGNETTGLTRSYEIVDWNDGDITNSVFDFDADGWPDVYIGSTDYYGTRGLLYRQVSPEVFEAVPLAEGIDHTRSHGSVIADFDRDGDLDIVVGHSSARCEDDCYESFSVRLFENQLGDTSNFIQLKLEGGEGTNRAAIGATVSVTAGGVTQTQQVDGGHGHYGNQDDLVLHFGLGESCEADVTIQWPDASLSEQSFTVGGGYRYVVAQGEDPEADL